MVVYLVLYDFPNESRARRIVGKGREKVKSLIRNMRVKSLSKLRRLGVGIVESTIVVPESRLRELEGTVREVKEMYRGASAGSHLLEQAVGKLEPKIVVVEVSEEEFEKIKPLAQEKICGRLDTLIRRILLGEARNKNRIMSEVRRIAETAGELGILSDKVKAKLATLVRLVEEA